MLFFFDREESFILLESAVHVRRILIGYIYPRYRNVSLQVRKCLVNDAHLSEHLHPETFALLLSHLSRGTFSIRAGIAARASPLYLYLKIKKKQKKKREPTTFPGDIPRKWQPHASYWYLLLQLMTTFGFNRKNNVSSYAAGITGRKKGASLSAPRLIVKFKNSKRR